MNRHVKKIKILRNLIKKFKIEIGIGKANSLLIRLVV